VALESRDEKCLASEISQNLMRDDEAGAIKQGKDTR
jgi:hypothetical protein